MKKLIHKFPIFSKYLLALLLFGICLILSGLINKGFIKEYFPYTSVILLFIATWWLLKSDKQSLKSIGLNSSLRNWSFLPLGVLIGALCFFGAKYCRAVYLGESIEISESVNYSSLLISFYFILPQVATEEFLFRAYLFKKTINTTNVLIANVLFSVLFMLIHVLDENVLSNKGMIILLAITIPVGHLLFATALLKSKTLFFPIGLHLGNNWATRHLLVEGQSENSLMFISETTRFEAWTPFIMSILIFNGFFLLVTFLIWKWDVIFKRPLKIEAN